MRSGSIRTVQADKVKTMILDAAIPLFARGFDSVSIQQIAAAAGIKHSLVMYHFGSKDQLWEQAALRLYQQFDQRQQEYVYRLPVASNEEEMIYNQLLAFIQALRDIPEYGQMLFSEGSQETDRLQWLHQNFFPSAVSEPALDGKHKAQALLKTTLLRNAVAGAMLFSVVAGPQLARTAELEGNSAGYKTLYPMQDEMAQQLAHMLTDFLLAELKKIID